MSEAIAARKLSALTGLVATCALWGLSFPVMKAFGLYAELRAPGISTWFVAASTVVVRFGVSALILAASGFGRPRRSELVQGMILGSFSAIGMLLQMDALNFTQASVSAFLTQGYIVILPVIGAIAARSLPRPKTVLCIALSVTGLAVLSGFDGSLLRLGRGETETLLAACSFAVQIQCLDAKRYAGNRMRVVTQVMFACVALAAVPVSFATMRSASDFALPFGSPLAALFIGILTIPCTTIAFTLMNRFQPAVSASEAGVIYGAEPLFASMLALFLPAWFARLAGVDYENESLGPALLLGGGLVALANVLLQLPLRLPPKRLTNG